MVPVTVPGGNPVTAAPGLTPKSPVMTLAPVLVTVDPPRTANGCAVPRFDCAQIAAPQRRIATTSAVRKRKWCECIGNDNRPVEVRWLFDPAQFRFPCRITITQ